MCLIRFRGFLLFTVDVVVFVVVVVVTVVVLVVVT